MLNSTLKNAATTKTIQIKIQIKQQMTQSFCSKILTAIRIHITYS